VIKMAEQFNIQDIENAARQAALSALSGIGLTGPTAIDDAAERAVEKVLKRIGLDGPEAGHEIRTLRDLLKSYQDATQTAKRTVVRTLTTALLVSLLAGAAVKLHLGYWK